MQTFEYRGEWWLPEDEDDRVAGVLEFNPETGGELNLIGKFGGHVHGPTGEVEVIHGEVTEGKKVTLRDCFIHQADRTTGTADTHMQEVSARKCFSDVLFPGGDIEFDKVKLFFPLLELWSARNTVVTPEGGVWGAEFAQFDPIEATLENASIKFNFENDQHYETWKGIELTQIAYLEVKPDQTLLFDDYLDKYVRQLQQFLCLAIGEPVNPKRVTGYFDSDGETHAVDVAYQVAYLPEVPERKHPGDLQFNLQEIDFEEALQNWFENSRDAETLHNLYFGTQYNNDMFEENKFLSLVIALESYQDYLFPDHQLMDSDEFSRLHDQIMDTIPDEAGAKERIDDLLRSIGNKGSLHDQLSMVFYEYEDILAELIEIDDVIRNAKNGRHNIAHGLGNSYDLNDLANTAQKLEVVIEAILLDAIGLDSGSITEKLQQNRQYILNR